MNDKLQVIFNMLIDSIELTKANLLNQSITEENIKELTAKAYLIDNENETYEYNKNRVEKLFQHYKKLVKEKQFDRAKKCLEACWQLNPYVRGVCIRKIIEDLDEPTEKTDDSKIYKAFTRFLKYLYTSKNKSDTEKRDDNLYLFLFSLIIDIPEVYIDSETQTSYKLREIVTSMKYQDDLRLEKTPKTKPENFIRKQIFVKKLAHACQLISERNDKELFSLKYHLLSKLTSKASNITRETKSLISQHISQGNYLKALEILQKDFNLRPQRIYEEIILVLLLKVIELSKTNIIPEKVIESPELKTKSDATRLLDAINRNDFEKAKEINKNDTESIGILLTKILEIIAQIKKNQAQASKDSETPNVELKRVLEDTQAWYAIITQFADYNLISFEEAIRKYGLITETRSLIILYAALECYQTSNLSEGDKYLKLVEETGKTNAPKIEILLNYVKSVKTNTEIRAKTRTLE